MEIDRLGRGDMEDQGLILKTFKNANTLIVTPRKIYDLNDEFDEEYTEFEAFMATGRVVRILEDGRGFSFRFEKLSPKAKRAIEEYVKTQ